MLTLLPDTDKVLRVSYLNQQAGEKGGRNYFMTKSLRKICGQTEDQVPDLPEYQSDGASNGPSGLAIPHPY